ncbi:Retrovirus-related Pol polyprotein from transposon opus [Thelohanellus kitauei]|uniref:Retrovirus-related Pol polyprotein from transposon opus n=1 Tax=Thelohanellus kitauei TaxID=669202 RepID=A0A0C2JX84_THEKT|nr:Retrovirus-related Pol polyprotein from transposon opus [Thelohanellus kitauei]
MVGEVLRAKLIRPSNSPWRSPITMPLKRMEVTLFPQYPLPDIDELLERLADTKIFSTLNLPSAYWQVPLKKEDMEKTAFSLGPGYLIYECLVMPFGLSGAPATCQRLLDLVLKDNRNALCYLDDIIIFSENQEEHAAHLRMTLNQIKGANLKLNR